MTESVTKSQAKFLIWLVMFLLGLMGFIASWSKVESTNTSKNLEIFKSDVSREYVTLERYKCDTERVEKSLDKIDRKLDRVSEKIGKIIE